MEFRLPELSEGIASAMVTGINVKAGDKVTSGQTLLEVQTDKANMPIEAPEDMTIDELRVANGQTVKIGDVLLTFGGSTAPTAKPAPAATAAPTAKPAPAATATTAPAKTDNAVTVTATGEMRLPVLGEGIAEATITSILLKVGETFGEGKDAFEVQTDKASMQVPAPSEGTLTELKVTIGQKVKIGDLLAVYTFLSSAPTAVAPSPAEVKTAAAKVQPTASPAAVAKPTANGSPTPAVAVDNSARTGAGRLSVPAGPATRRFARELGLNLGEVPGTGRGGRINSDDIKAFVKKKMTAPAPVAAPAASGGMMISAPPMPDFAKYGPVEKKPVTPLRKKIAENLTLAWHMAPMVTQYDLADITELEAGRRRIVESMGKDSPKITMTVLAVKAVVAALKSFPNFNASYDPTTGELIVKQYYHIGIAVDTERGLVVPVIKDADKKSIATIAKEVVTLAEKARQGKLSLDDMRGGTFTITNLGGLGGTAFSPIVNYPELAILGMAKSSLQPVIRDGKVEARLMLPLCLSYDHRIIDGADGARFTTRLAQMFTDPLRLLMEG